MKKLSELCARTLRGALSLAVALAFSASAAFAQVPSFQNPPFQPSTFMVGVTITPSATTAGDLFCITGSATRLVKVKSIRLNGIQSTTAQTIPFNLIKRSAASTGGTATQPAGVPLDTSQIVTAATATINAYTGVPTPGAAVGTISSKYLNAGLATGAITDDNEYVWSPQNLYSDVRLRGVAQQLCINSPIAYTATPTFAIEVIWTEQ